MAIKMSMTCSRCHREDTLDLETLAEAQAFEAIQMKKKATLKRIQEFVATLPVEDLPDFFAIIGGERMVHPHLCDPKDDGKRSCASRIGDLLADAAERPERKPRVKKAPEAVVPVK